jgi:hypothetical protein
MNKNKLFLIKLLTISILAASSIYFLLRFDSYLQPYIEDEIIMVLAPVIIFSLLMKLVGFGYSDYIDGKNIFQLLTHILYQFRWVVAFLIFFIMMFHSIGKSDSLVHIMGEYFAGKTKEQILTVYNVEDEYVYDHKNRVFYLYNEDIELKEQYTYKITYLDTSRIIVNVDGPLNTGKFDFVDTVQIKEAVFKNGKVFLEWEPFILEGEESKKYRIKSYVKKEDGTLMRSGSQMIIEDKKTTATIENLLEDKEYQFVIEPYFNNRFDEEHKGTSEFISTK